MHHSYKVAMAADVQPLSPCSMFSELESLRFGHDPQLTFLNIIRGLHIEAHVLSDVPRQQLTGGWSGLELIALHRQGCALEGQSDINLTLDLIRQW
jgi:hypothetical protein